MKTKVNMLNMQSNSVYKFGCRTFIIIFQRLLKTLEYITESLD